EELVSGLRSEDEHSLILLLQSELEPLFDRLSGYGDDVAEKVSTYRAALDETLGIVYRKRRAYEASVTQVNDCISAFLDQAEEKAQQMIPHYFEKYKTDGVDYNIYAGASLMENGEFDELDLKNLKIWQLMTMAGIVWEMNRLKTKMAMPLETAHLILVQSEPLSIRFRVDEKKFDVDGAYNIRYEIIKKRIDKARIAGTSERLTQPGKLAIVYSQSAEAREYERYIEYLQAAGYLDPGIERVELEALQGVHGLRALRVIVADNKPVSDLQLSKNVSISRLTEDDIVEQSVGT
ncbi:MAG: GAF domain-containing protein, partial [Bacteroidetes bacterium]|nr:GAF domain-containing protein [Bacteroidota bacterium]